MGRMKDLIADEWDRAYRQGYDDAIAEHCAGLSQIFDSPATSAVQTEQQPSELQGKVTHLLECRHAKHTHAPDPWCDCGILRACEKRVLTDLVPNLHIADMQGYNRALTAAREAIKAMPTIEDLDGHTYLDLTVREIIAAIEAMP